MDQNEKRDKQHNSDSLLMRLWSRSKKGRGELEMEQPEEPLQEQAPSVEETGPAPEVEAAESVSAAEEQGEEVDSPLRQESEEDAVDSKVQVTIPSDRMSAVLWITPPRGDGAHVTEEMIRSALAEKGVVFGLKDSLVAMAVKTRMYQRELTIARGEAPQAGEDGSVKELFERENTMRPTANEDGTVDFKNLNMIRLIRKGEKICAITLPTPAVPGTDVLGHPVPGIDGKNAIAPKGWKTELNADGTALVASCNGSLQFVDGLFRVDEVLKIDGDVDNSIGNIDFCGDVEIKGNVREGFAVKSGGNITINGLVEGASVIAKGNITVAKGMNGMDKGVLEAGKDIRCRFLESCSVKAGGSIYAESMMNLTAFAEGSILLDGQRGVMIGGTYTAQHEIQAKAVGALSSTVTTVVLGSSPEVLQEHKRMSNLFKELKQEMDGLEKDLNYLTMKQRANQLTPQQAEMLRQKTKRKTIALMEASRCNKKLEELTERINNTADCKLSCGRIYPRVKIVMRSEVMTIQAQESLKLFYWSEGKICKGSITGMMR